MAKQSGSTSNIGQRVVPGRAIPGPSKAADWLSIARALDAEMRGQYGIPAGADTVAVGWTGIEGLEAQRFVGASRSIRDRAALPSPTPHINAPRANSQFLDHAEQDVANAFIDALSALRPAPSTEGEWLRIFVSHADGPCAACRQGLGERQVAPGVLAQLSRRYPGLTVTMFWEDGDAKLGYVIFQNGMRLH